MITSTQAAQYLDQVLGVGVPDFIVDAAVAKVATAEADMIAAGYSVYDQTMIQTIAVALICAAGDPRRVTNQHAPSGAARGFKYRDNDLSALRRSLAALDTAGTVSDLIGTDAINPALMMVV